MKPDIRSNFQGCEYWILATNHWKVRRKSGFPLLFLLPKSSFGEHGVVTKDSSIPEKPARHMLLLSSVSSCKVYAPQTTIWKEEKRRNLEFLLTVQCFVAQIEYSRTWKVLLNSALGAWDTLRQGVSNWFGFGQQNVEKCFEKAFCSFGMGKMVFLTSITRSVARKTHFQPM